MWLSVTLDTDAEHAERLSDALMEEGALSVEVQDAEAGTEHETPQFGEPGSSNTPLWSQSRVVALFEPGQDVIGRVAAACAACGIDDLPELTLDEVAEQNWVQLTQSQFEPIRINDRLWIVPSWHNPPDATAINLELDPGLAFGTGSHPTTRLCLEWLCDTPLSGKSVLDYGCGSGILGIAAARLGAHDVTGVDIDAKALEAAADNVTRNHVSMRLLHSNQALAETFDMVIANILTNPLCVLAPALCEHLAPGGKIALSGVLEAQAEQVIEAYAPWVALKVGAAHEGWVRLEGVRCS
ncbi:MAG: methylase for ribosomal subunit protein [Pseudomonadota bacterium]|jgi:ribosomal protein L11 methyltransferase